jgi:hypothetical protein
MVKGKSEDWMKWEKSYRKNKSKNGRTRTSEQSEVGPGATENQVSPVDRSHPARAPFPDQANGMNCSQDQCQERLNDSYETYQTACGLKKGYMGK